MAAATWHRMSNRILRVQIEVFVITFFLFSFLFNYFNVWLLDYLILMKARQDELIHKSITLHNQELIPRWTAIMRSQIKNEWGKFVLLHQDLNHGPLEPKANLQPISYALNHSNIIFKHSFILTQSSFVIIENHFLKIIVYRPCMFPV